MDEDGRGLVYLVSKPSLARLGSGISLTSLSLIYLFFYKMRVIFKGSCGD